MVFFITSHHPCLFIFKKGGFAVDVYDKSDFAVLQRDLEHLLLDSLSHAIKVLQNHRILICTLKGINAVSQSMRSRQACHADCTILAEPKV